ncbi:uncharacterized protein Eint_090270 [Encephalitozoon intestinalis ATCC 50506]|uniref:DUF5096 domain-containing protein n=1 Tax=Encephalitozoon intestinalis (strain ATCC 50506) TaxID=876142 RepID=E0S975_ENCIT|nr:uncharacterized protein Eint_090270 [Encephalitozoon intestinalis ATCC 50506]ADM12157.1 hypothetical protein Eint_090270 [Encephalitozoon intestinalis ATCC 50506]UTX45959.1 DUF5096 domain-containing protein [Encephalitozoon intestinalis]
MEDYIGIRLLFETSKGVISGMLRAVDENSGKLIIEDMNEMKDVLIEDIQRLEIAEESSPNLSVGHNSKEEKRLENTPSIDVDSKGMAGKVVSGKHLVGYSSRKENLDLVSEKSKSGQTDESRTSYENDDNVRSSSKVGSDRRRDGYNLETSEEDYYRMMGRAFSYFGPLEEEFCSIAARQTYRIFSTYFNNSSLRVEVFVAGDDVFSSIGFILGRLLLHTGKMSSIICNENLLRNTRYRQSYLNSGGVITNRPAPEPSIHIYSCNKSLVPAWARNNIRGSIYLDMPGHNSEEKETKIGLCFGSIPAYHRRFNGIVYFVDIEYPAPLYEEFGLQKPTRSKIHKVK